MKKYEDFIAGICNTKLVYTLKNEQGFATTSSINYEGAAGQKVPVVCFWSDLAMAQACCPGAWEDFEPVAYTLQGFLEQLCVWLASQGILIGVDFDDEMYGFEAEPPALIRDVMALLAESKIELPLEIFDNLEEVARAAEKTLIIE